MINEIIFLLHTLIAVFFSFGALWLGEHALVATLCLFGVLSNVFIAKQMTLFGFAVTCSDVYAVGSILCLNVLQEYFGKLKVTRAIGASFLCITIFFVMSQLHLWYLPNHFDTAHPHYQALMGIMPRITIASMISYLVVQCSDARFFAMLQKLFRGKFFTARAFMSLVVSQTLDTVLFSFLGLYGIVGSVLHVIVVSLAVKLTVIVLSAPLLGFVKKYIHPQKQ